MKIEHNTLVLVADGKKYLLLRNGGDAKIPLLRYEGGGEHENPSTHEQGSDQPGRAFASTGSVRSAVDQTDFHQLEKDRFAGDIAELLGKLADAGDFEELVVVAPPRTLAELRKRFDRSVEKRIVAEVDKDLVKHPVDEITEILMRED